MASLKDIAKQLNKEYKDDNLAIISNIRPEYKRLASGALGMDYVLFGGLPEGRLCVYSGLPHSGKTTAACAELGASDPSLVRSESTSRARACILSSVRVDRCSPILLSGT